MHTVLVFWHMAQAFSAFIPDETARILGQTYFSYSTCVMASFSSAETSFAVSSGGPTLRTARWSTARLDRHRLLGTDEAAEKFAVNLRGDCIGINALIRQKGPGVVCPIDPGRLDFNVLESRRHQLPLVLVLLQRPSHAADPGQHAPPDFRQHLALRDHIRHGEAATGFQHSECFVQNTILVSAEIDNAVGNDYINGMIGKWDILDLSPEEFDILHACFRLVFIDRKSVV